MPKKTLILRLDDNADEARLRELLAGLSGVDVAEDRAEDDPEPRRPADGLMSLEAFEAQLLASEAGQAMTESERQGILAGYRDRLAGRSIPLEELKKELAERRGSRGNRHG